MWCSCFGYWLLLLAELVGVFLKKDLRGQKSDFGSMHVLI